MSINCMRNVGVAHWRVSGPRRAEVTLAVSTLSSCPPLAGFAQEYRNQRVNDWRCGLLQRRWVTTDGGARCIAAHRLAVWMSASCGTWRPCKPPAAAYHVAFRRLQPLSPAPPQAQDDIRAFLEKPDAEGIKAMTSGLLESDPEVKEQLQKIQEAMARVDRCRATPQGHMRMHACMRANAHAVAHACAHKAVPVGAGKLGVVCFKFQAVWLGSCLGSSSALAR
eukprot:352869-Chlamydomonas_euryale.AAC.6